MINLDAIGSDLMAAYAGRLERRRRRRRLVRNAAIVGSVAAVFVSAAVAGSFGSDLQLESIDDIWDEIEEMSPTHRGVTAGVLSALAATDGIVVPSTAKLASSVPSLL